MKLSIFVLTSTSVVGNLFGGDLIADYQGAKIILHDDKTWEYEQIRPADLDDQMVLVKSASQSESLTSPTKKYVINYNPSLWERSKPFSEAAEFGFQNKAKNAFGMAIYDGIEVPLNSMENIVIKNANNIDPNAKIVNIRKCKINGTEGELVTYLATGSGVPFTLLTFLASGPFGTIQYTFFTSSSLFDALQEDFVEMISGLEF